MGMYVPLLVCVSIAMDVKQSLEIIPLLIAAPARWTRVSTAGLLSSLILTFALPTDEWVQYEWVKCESEYCGLTQTDMMTLIKSSTFGLSVLGAWLAPWMAACVAAARQFCTTDVDKEFLELFLDNLTPEFSVQPHSRVLSLSTSLLPVQEVFPLGFLVLEATNI